MNNITPADLNQMLDNAGRMTDAQIWDQIGHVDDHYNQNPEWNQAYLDILYDEISMRRTRWDDDETMPCGCQAGSCYC
jgi:hypothetical protein